MSFFWQSPTGTASGVTSEEEEKEHLYEKTCVVVRSGVSSTSPGHVLMEPASSMSLMLLLWLLLLLLHSRRLRD